MKGINSKLLNNISQQNCGFLYNFATIKTNIQLFVPLFQIEHQAAVT